MDALKEYYEENDGGGEQMMKYSWNFFIKSLSFVKFCSDGGAIGGARSSYRLCDNLLDHGDLQIHLWLVELLRASPHLNITLRKILFTIVKMSHMNYKKMLWRAKWQNLHCTVHPTLKHKHYYYHQSKIYLPRNVKCSNTIPVPCVHKLEINTILKK